jgi:hypothetical protein
MIFLLSTRNIGNHYFLNKTTAFYMLFFIIYKLFARTMRETPSRQPIARTLRETMRETKRENQSRNPFAKTSRENQSRNPCARPLRETPSREPARDPFTRPYKISHTETTLTILVRLHSININGNKKNPLSSGYFRPPKMAKKNLHEIWPPKKNESTVQKTTSVPPY